MGEVAMKEWRGVWFPANEEHLIQWMKGVDKVVHGKPTYQYHKYEAARELCKQRRRVIDVGGNIGLWAMFMVHDFQYVESFEPVKEYGDIFVRNAPTAKLHRVALGNTHDQVCMVKATANSCGDTRPWVNGDPASSIVQLTVDMFPLDDYSFDEVDLIKIDCEGYELFVLEGAIETIQRNRPVIIVEQKKGHGTTFGLKDTQAVDYLKGLGMKLHSTISGDFIMVW